MIESANLILNITKSYSKLIFEDLPVDDSKQRKPAINKAEKFLEWKPKISIESGLKNTLNYFKKVLNL